MIVYYIKAANTDFLKYFVSPKTFFFIERNFFFIRWIDTDYKSRNISKPCKIIPPDMNRELP